MSSTGTLLNMATCIGKELDFSSRILDFGCGNGERVKALRNEGYDAYGVDVKFKLGPNVEELQLKGVIKLIDMDNYRISFPDDFFDFVFSEQVFEHVQNYEETLMEIARVMKFGAMGYHRFPSRLRPFESHVNVPFSSVFRPYWWMVLWSGLGFCKSSQKEREVAKVAQSNREYLERSTNYLSGRLISKYFRKSFRMFGYAEACWFTNSPNRRGRLLGCFARILPLVPLIYRTFWTRTIYHVK